MEQSFFEESDFYWEPSSNPPELYSQLSKFKYREIARNQIKYVECNGSIIHASIITHGLLVELMYKSVSVNRVTNHLGSGNFATVYKGLWHSPYGDKDVAVKMLQKGAAECSEVKFLQEAAIMGQFQTHPNVVKLHGVVTVGEPVSTYPIVTHFHVIHDFIFLSYFLR